MRRLLPLGLILIVALVQASPVAADDSDIFTSQRVQPNVVILIDTSGSMNDPVAGQAKIVTAKSVVTNLVQNVQGVRFGIFSFNSTSTGAHLVAPVGSSVATMVTAISALAASGWTPLGRSAQDIQNYFRGTFLVSGVAQPSPIQYECQKNYLILMTDGLPTAEDVNLISQVASSLHATDHGATFAGVQNVIVSTIGFAVPEGTALLTQTAANGGGTFYTANSYQELQNSLQTALQDIVEDNYNFTAPLIPATSVGGGARAYFASFRPDAARPFWRGYLSAYTRNAGGLIPVGADGIPDSATLAWEAGAVLAARAPSSRAIFTIVGGVRQDFIRTNGNLTPALLGLTTPTERDALMDFVRGIDTFDEDADGDATENRAWKLGDIYHSVPVLVGPPPLKVDDPSYTTFRQARAARTKVLLVGANDGMLHAFREADGEELWAFIPPDLLGSLKKLRPAEGDHTSFVDASPIVADIKIGVNWKTIVLFGERAGGRALHALDVTDTTSPTYLWSFTDARVGETWSEPAIGRVRMADTTVKSVAFFGGGYDSASNNATGKGFFVVDLATGVKLWEYVNTGSGDSAQLNFSIAAPPAAADVDGNGFVDRVYVADVGGQIWKLDVSAPATLSGSLVDNWSGKRLFVASPTQPNPPPAGEYRFALGMYGRPSLALDNERALWLYLGTGDRSHPNDASASRFYAIKEDTTMAQGAALSESSLVNAALTNDSITQGWYMSLAAREKVLSSPQVYDRVVYFSTFTSNVAASCTNPGGIAKLYAVQMDRGDSAFDWTTGTNTPGENSGTPSETVGGGIPSTPQVVQGTPNDAVVVSTTEGEIKKQDRPSAIRKRLRYWKETY